MRNAVDLPQPEGPSSETNSPARTLKVKAPRAQQCRSRTSCRPRARQRQDDLLGFDRLRRRGQWNAWLKGRSCSAGPLWLFEHAVYRTQHEVDSRLNAQASFFHERAPGVETDCQPERGIQLAPRTQPLRQRGPKSIHREPDASCTISRISGSTSASRMTLPAISELRAYQA